MFVSACKTFPQPKKTKQNKQTNKKAKKKKTERTNEKGTFKVCILGY